MAGGRQSRGRVKDGVKEGGRNGGNRKGVNKYPDFLQTVLPLHNHSWKYLLRK